MRERLRQVLWPHVYRWKLKLREVTWLPGSCGSWQSLNWKLAVSRLSICLLAPRPILGTSETLGPSLQDIIGFGWVGSN